MRRFTENLKIISEREIYKKIISLMLFLNQSDFRMLDQKNVFQIF